jgi:hypothetical protein
MLLTFLLQIGQSWTVWAIPALSALLAAATTYGVGLLTSGSNFRKDYLERLEKAERGLIEAKEAEAKCMEREINLKSVMSSLVLEHQIVLDTFPEAAEKVEKMRSRMRRLGEKDPLGKFKDILAEDAKEIKRVEDTQKQK